MASFARVLDSWKAHEHRLQVACRHHSLLLALLASTIHLSIMEVCLRYYLLQHSDLLSTANCPLRIQALPLQISTIFDARAASDAAPHLAV